MKKYITLILVLSINLLIQYPLLATRIVSNEESLKFFESQDEWFKRFILTNQNYEYWDPDQSIRFKLFDFQDSSFSSLSEELAGDTVEEVMHNYDLGFKGFLKFAGESTDGSFDLSNPHIKAIYLLFGYYAMDRTVHDMLMSDVDEGDKSMLLACLNKLSPQIATLPPQNRFLVFRNMHACVNFQVKNNPGQNSEETNTYISELKENIRQKYFEQVMHFLNDPGINYNDYMLFTDLHAPAYLLFLITTPQGIFLDNELFHQMYNVDEKFLQTANSREQLAEMRENLTRRAHAFNKFSEEFTPTKSDSEKNIFMWSQDLSVRIFTHWINHKKKDMYKLSTIDYMFAACLAANLQDNLSPGVIKQLEQDFPMGLSALEKIDDLTQMMLFFIKQKSADLYRKFNISGDTHLREIIHAFEERMLRKAEEEKLKVQQANKVRAGGMFYERLKDNLAKLHDGLKAFVDRHQAFQYDREICNYLGQPMGTNGLEFLDSMAKIHGVYANQSWYLDISKTIKELLPIKAKVNGDTPVTIQDLKALDQKMKALDQLYKEAEAFFEKDAKEKAKALEAHQKAQKKRMKAEAKAQEKAERAKQKAEEKAKRESIKRLSLKMATPSPDPSPYPSGAEKRLSVKAEIAEKHRSATLRLVEKEQRKSLRQSVKDLLHIGEADTQKDKRDSKRFSQRSSKRKSEVLDEKPEAPLDLSQFGAVDRASIDKETLEIWEGKRVVTHQDSVVAILDQINGATSLKEIIDGFSKGNNFKTLNASSKLKDFKFSKKGQVYSIRVHGKADKHRICFIWDDKEKKARKVQYGTYH